MRLPRWQILAASVAAAGVIAGTSGCTAWNVNWNQWSQPPRSSVQLLGDGFDIKPFTYVGHDPVSYKAADFMLPDNGVNGENSYWVQRGWQLAHYAQANHTKLDVHYIVFRQHIWNVERASEGWRLMANRGDWTQNHMNHVHISFY
jgi:hypothetical protein